MKTFLPQPDRLDKKWYVVSAENQVLGRLATRVAALLMGKTKPWYVDFLDTGDFVIVVDAEKVRLTGRKWDQKKYYSHSGYPGGLRERTARELRQKHPDRLIRSAVKGMLPKNKLGDKMSRKLKVYAGDQHPHQAQRPEALNL